MHKILVACVLAACAGSSLAQQPSKPPDPPSAEVFNAWLTSFNSGERAAVTAFHSKYGRGDSREVDRDLDMRERTGGFDLQSVESATATSFAALLRERGSGRFGRVQIDLEPGSPPRIAGMRLQPVMAPSRDGLPPKSNVRGTQADALARLKSHLEAQAGADRFAGAVLVAKDGKVVFEQAYGLANRARHTPNVAATRFRIGSMNKMFTAVAILQLVEAGKLKLSDPLVKYLPNYPNRELAQKVTLDQLLTHRGGTGDFFVPEYFASKDSIRTLDDYVELLGPRAPRFEPGERFEYSNYGYILLGVVIERVAGESYYEYVQKEIYQRAGMRRSGSEPESRKVADLAVGYTREAPEQDWQSNASGLPYRGTSAGGGYSTVGDLLAFAEALRNQKLLGAAGTAQMMRGYALRNMLGDGSGFVGHNGGAPGMNGDLRIYPRAGYVAIALANVDPPAADEVTEVLDASLPLR